jgi:hypothetical protein
MYQVAVSVLLNVVSVAAWGHVLKATASRAYAQVGDDHAPGRWYEHGAPLIAAYDRPVGHERHEGQ